MSEPSEMEISICYEGDGMPSIEQLRERQALEKRLEQAGYEITDTGAGDGALDIVIEVEDGAGARAEVVRLVDELGLAERTTIDVVPLDDA